MKTRPIMLLAVIACIATTTQADSLFTQTAAKSGTLVAENVMPFKVGDIITVTVSETIQSSTVANTRTTKESELESQANAEDNPLLTGSGAFRIPSDLLPNIGIETENETNNRGATTRNSTLTTTVSCIVVRVYPNGNLLIEGTKQVTVNRENSTLLVRGVLRARDVTPQNTVTSSLLANSVVQLCGKGPLWNNQRRGLITRLFDWISPN
jgi:flagellar L-ring protein precursor FlgH